VTAAEPILTAHNLCAGYGGAQILLDVSLTVRRGQVLALTGRNGAGKSTILKTLMGLVAAQRGRVTFMGRDITRAPPHLRAGLGLGYVPEDRRIFTALTVRENLEAGRQPPRAWPDGSPAPHWNVERLLDIFPNLRDMQRRPASQMSGGEQQMLALARTLMGNPLLVLLDEPSEGVAPIIVQRLAEVVLELKRAGMAILLSEQNRAFAHRVADCECAIDQGRIMAPPC
jgi:branched-chain amino acid transport system ATP-binding protein